MLTTHLKRVWLHYMQLCSTKTGSEWIELDWSVNHLEAAGRVCCSEKMERAL